MTWDTKLANPLVISSKELLEKQNIVMTSGDMQVSPFVISTSERS